MRRTIVRIGATGAGALLAVGLLGALPAGATGSGGHGKSARSGSTACFTAGGPQGKSHSDPDGMSNGGADKPGCTGGFDADKDGNNGCGNDADREDDNNGNCGRKKSPGTNVRSPKADRDDEVHGAEVEADRKTRCEGHKGATTTTTTTAVTPTAVSDAGAATCTCPKDSNAAVGTTVAGVSLQAAAVVPAAGVPAAEASQTTTTPPAAVSVAGDTGPTAVEAAAVAAAPGTEVLGETLSRPSALARTGAGIGGMALLGGLLCGGGRLAVLARRLLRIG